MSSSELAAEWVPHMQAAAGRIHELAPAFAGHLTSADPESREQWDQGQVLSHVAEMLRFWVGEVERVVAAGGGVEFGRVKSTPSRLERIEGGRHVQPEALLRQMDEGLAQVAALLDRLTPEQLALTGRHPSKGDMTMAAAVDDFLVRHLDEHAAQLAE